MPARREISKSFAAFAYLLMLFQIKPHKLQYASAQGSKECKVNNTFGLNQDGVRNCDTF